MSEKTKEFWREMIKSTWCMSYTIDQTFAILRRMQEFRKLEDERFIWKANRGRLIGGSDELS